MKRFWHRLFGHGHLPVLLMKPDGFGEFRLSCHCGKSWTGEEFRQLLDSKA